MLRSSSPMLIAQTYSKWWLPLDVSTSAATIDSLMLYIHIFMLVLFIGWGAFFVYCLFRFRDRPGAIALYEPVNGSFSKWLEVGIVVIEAVLLLAFSMPVWADFKDVAPKDGDPNAIHVRVVGKQFNWFFHYPGKDGKFGKTEPRFVSEDNPVGRDPRDADGKDDFVLTEKLVFPSGRPVVARISSFDVIHSFKIPVMRLTQDAIPGQNIEIWFEALRDREGIYDIACAQLCGTGHTTMKAYAIVTTEDEYDQKFAVSPEAAIKYASDRVREFTAADDSKTKTDG
jgi:cytochrome c oxidase subunit 2